MSDMFVIGGRSETSSLRTKPITDQMHGFSLANYREGRPWRWYIHQEITKVHCNICFRLGKCQVRSLTRHTSRSKIINSYCGVSAPEALERMASVGLLRLIYRNIIPAVAREFSQGSILESMQEARYYGEIPQSCSSPSYFASYCMMLPPAFITSISIFIITVQSYSPNAALRLPANVANIQESRWLPSGFTPTTSNISSAQTPLPPLPSGLFTPILQCDAVKYGHDLNYDSCDNAYRQIPNQIASISFGPRTQGNWDFHLPYRVYSCR